MNSSTKKVEWNGMELGAIIQPISFGENSGDSDLWDETELTNKSKTEQSFSEMVPTTSSDTAGCACELFECDSLISDKLLMHISTMLFKATWLSYLNQSPYFSEAMHAIVEGFPRCPVPAGAQGAC